MRQTADGSTVPDQQVRLLPRGWYEGGAAGKYYLMASRNSRVPVVETVDNLPELERVGMVVHRVQDLFP